MRLQKLRWVLAVLYVLHIAVWWGIAAFGDDPDVRRWIPVTIVIVLATQALFVFGGGRLSLCQPIEPGRLVAPVFIGSLLMAALVTGGVMALIELFAADDNDYGGVALLVVMFGGWAGWAAYFWQLSNRLDRLPAAERMVAVLAKGSIAELLVTIPAHITVINRPGCLVGILTGAGVAAGCSVLLWVFGPGILLVFYKRRQQLLAERARSGRDSAPDSGPAVEVALFVALVCTTAVFARHEYLHDTFDHWEPWAVTGLIVALTARVLWRLWRYDR